MTNTRNSHPELDALYGKEAPTYTADGGLSYLASDFASAGYCHFPGCENRERVWMDDKHVAIADGLCASHSNLARCGAPLNAAKGYDACAEHGPGCTTRVTRFRVDATAVAYSGFTRT